MRGRRAIPAFIGIVLVALLVWIRLVDPFALQTLRELAFDTYQRAAPREAVDAPIRIVDIDEASLAEIGQWPWPRNVLAELTDTLTQMGAAAVVFDVLFPEPDRASPSRIAAELDLDDRGELRDYDVEFAEAISRSPVVLGFGVTPRTGPMPATAKTGFAVVGPNADIAVPIMPGAVSSLPMLVAAARGLGSISLDPAGNVSVVRELPLLWSTGEAFYPALTLEALRVAVGAPTTVIFADQTGFGVVEAVRIAGTEFEVPTTPGGTLRLYYQETPDDLYVPAAGILGAESATYAPLIAGNIVFVGTSATGLLDIRGTPLGTNMPGVEIHVQALQQILGGSYLERADWVSGLEILAFVIIGVVLIAVVHFLGPLVSALIGGVLAAIVAIGSWLAFTDAGLLVDPTFPLVASLIVYFSMVFARYVITDADKRRIRSAFGNYVSPELLGQIEKNSGRLRLGGETRELSILFSDVRSFTTLSEGFEPADLVNLLNRLFGALGSEITDELGTIDKFIGDAIMAFWNAPVDVEDHALRACRAALAMRIKLAELNEADGFELRSGGRAVDRIEIGIGIATGDALVGNLGLETRFDYSCVGDTVNIASRVEGACKALAYDLVVSGETRAGAPGLAFLEAGSLELKGKTNREPIHILLGGPELTESEAFRKLREAHWRAVEALKSGENADAAIDECIALITFPEPRLRDFYEAMRTRPGDFADTRISRGVEALPA